MSAAGLSLGRLIADFRDNHIGAQAFETCTSAVLRVSSTYVIWLIRATPTVRRDTRLKSFMTSTCVMDCRPLAQCFLHPPAPRTRS